MSRYVDIEGDWVDDAVKAYSLGYYDDDEYAIPVYALDSAPSIDICFCRECKYFHEEGITSDKDYYCERCHDKDGFWREVKPDDFCSYGERREK